MAISKIEVNGILHDIKASSCTGNSATATSATNDSDGNKISDTYLKKTCGAVTVPDNALDVQTAYKYIPENSWETIHTDNSFTANNYKTGTFTITHGDWYKVSFGNESFTAQCRDDAIGTSEAGKNKKISDGTHTLWVSYYDNYIRLTGFSGTKKLVVQKSNTGTQVKQIGEEYLDLDIPKVNTDTVSAAVPGGVGYYSFPESALTTVGTLTNFSAGNIVMGISGIPTLTIGSYYKITYNDEILIGQCVDDSASYAPSGSAKLVSDEKKRYE